VIDKGRGIKAFGLNPDIYTILVVGGSQGAHSVNDAFVGGLRLLTPELKGRLQVIHITGVKDYEWAMPGILQLPVLNIGILVS